MRQQDEYNGLNVLLALRNTFTNPKSKKVMAFVLVLFITALLVVYVKNRYRQAFIQYQQLQAQQQQLHTQWMNILLEESTWGNYSRIEKIATENMGMTVPTAQNIKILVLPGNTPVNGVPNLSDNDSITSTS
ncbi:MAG: cell division protein FtsL [Gammaproteobacteria bacterium]|jgi:cell division protein FtsL|nr:cell division protein FtsL [Gammaproteobacteria bacterium]